MDSRTDLEIRLRRLDIPPSTSIWVLARTVSDLASSIRYPDSAAMTAAIVLRARSENAQRKFWEFHEASCATKASRNRKNNTPADAGRDATQEDAGGTHGLAWKIT
jgi:hypothetical protein